jgi:hypothetical protein
VTKFDARRVMRFSFEEGYVLKLRGRLCPEFSWKAMHLICEEGYGLKLRGRLWAEIARKTMD